MSYVWTDRRTLNVTTPIFFNVRATFDPPLPVSPISKTTSPKQRTIALTVREKLLYLRPVLRIYSVR